MKFHRHSNIQNGGNCERIGCEINPFGAKIGARGTKQNGRGGGKPAEKTNAFLEKSFSGSFKGDFS